MCQFLPSPCWFIFSVVLGILGFLMLVISLAMSESIPYGQIWQKLKFLIISAIGCLLLSATCLICGWRAPEHLHHTTITVNEVVIPPDVMTGALSKAIESMPDDIKYKVLTERMK